MASKSFLKTKIRCLSLPNQQDTKSNILVGWAPVSLRDLLEMVLSVKCPAVDNQLTGTVEKTPTKDNQCQTTEMKLFTKLEDDKKCTPFKLAVKQSVTTTA